MKYINHHLQLHIPLRSVIFPLLEKLPFRERNSNQLK